MAVARAAVLPRSSVTPPDASSRWSGAGAVGLGTSSPIFHAESSYRAPRTGKPAISHGDHLPRHAGAGNDCVDASMGVDRACDDEFHTGFVRNVGLDRTAAVGTAGGVEIGGDKTVQPSARKCSTTSRPIPRTAPVTMATGACPDILNALLPDARLSKNHCPGPTFIRRGPPDPRDARCASVFQKQTADGAC